MTYDLLPAHGLSVVIVVATMLIVPFYIYATYVASGASRRTGAALAIATTVFGALMFWICLATIPDRLGVPGNLIVPVSWIAPSLLLYLGRHYFLQRPLSQHWLVGLQIFRVIGGVFLIEMALGNLPGIFAYPAGIGDILVGLVALFVILGSRGKQSVSKTGILWVAASGIADFISAFFFGFFSSETPLQIFHPETVNRVILFPTGMIPLFLVPYAIFFHVLSLLNLKLHGSGEA